MCSYTCYRTAANYTIYYYSIIYYFKFQKLIEDNRKTNAHYQLNVWLRYATFDDCLGATCKLVGQVDGHHYPSEHNVTPMSVEGVASGVDSWPTLKQRCFNVFSRGWA